MIWRNFQIWRARRKLAAINRILDGYAYEGDPNVWQAIRLVESLDYKLKGMRP